MLGGIRSYIILNYLKYILINIIIFIGLIWLSQILRILEIQHSVTTQLIEVAKTTLLVLPSFINPLMPFLLLLASFCLNYKFNTNSEIVIIKQYFRVKDNYLLFTIVTVGIFLIYFVNNEYFSVKLYEKYKVQELEIRNNLKLGVPSMQEFHIENEVSIFFKKQKDNKFIDIEAIIFDNNQFIKSENAEIEIENKSYNLIFNRGERLILNDDEKSKTKFDKFIYSIENNEIEILMLDKEHFNTFQLLQKKDLEFFYHGHNRLYQYILTLFIIFISIRIFFLYVSKKSILKYYFILFLSLLILQLLNAYLIFLLNNNNNLNLYFYYILNFLILSTFSFFVLNFNENN